MNARNISEARTLVKAGKHPEDIKVLTDFPNGRYVPYGQVELINGAVIDAMLLDSFADLSSGVKQSLTTIDAEVENFAYGMNNPKSKIILLQECDRLTVLAASLRKLITQNCGAQ